MFVYGFWLSIPSANNCKWLDLFNILKKESLSENRGWVLVLSFTFGMLLSPPDVISQIMLAVPVYLLFELGLYSAMKRKRNNILKKEVKSAKYRQRIEKSKKQYSRKNSKDFVNLED